MDEPRNLYFDFLRGIAIIMVVGIHTFLSADAGFGSFHEACHVIIRQLFNCAVPLFLAISGFFLAGKDLSEKVKRYAFWKHQISKVYFPTLIWGVPWLILSITGGTNFTKAIVLWLFCGLSVFYYIALIIQFYLLLPTIQHFSFNTFKCSFVSALISLVSIVIVTWVRAYKGVNLPMIVYAGLFPVWIFFFVFGVALSKTKRDYSLWWGILAVVISLFLQFIEAHYLVSIGAAGYGIKLSSFVYSAFVILLLFSKRIEKFFNSERFSSKLIVNIGTLSFGIYLSHMLVYKVLKHWWLIDGWFLRFLVVLALDILLVFSLKRILPNKVSKLLGV